MSHIENHKEAAAQQIKANLVDETQRSVEDPKSALKSQEKRAGVISSLNDLTEDLLEQKQVADDKQKLQNYQNSGNSQEAPVSQGEKAEAPQAPPTEDAPSNDKDTRMDPLLALVMAGIDNQTQTNLIITALGAAGEAISKVTTNASDQGNDWLNNFYNHGITGHPGQTGENPGIYDTAGSSGIPGATGTANSAMFNQLVMIWQYVQQQVSQINNQFQTVAGLPSTMMQTLVQAVNTANSGQSSTVQAMGTTTNLVNGWAGV